MADNRVAVFLLAGFTDFWIDIVNFLTGFYPNYFDMRFFSRIVFVCNVCFILAVIIWWIEKSKRSMGNYDGALRFQPLEATLVILGYGAILVNALFVLFALYCLFANKLKTVPRWILIFNLLLFPVQVWYHFFLH